MTPEQIFAMPEWEFLQLPMTFADPDVNRAYGTRLAAIMNGSRPTRDTVPSRHPKPVESVAVPASAWAPVDLVAAEAEPEQPPCIGGLLYVGKRTVLSGETESLKTWLAMILCKAEIDAGYPVCWADVDAMGRGAILDRLRSLGVTDTAISEQFMFFEPDASLTGDSLDYVVALVKIRGVRLFVFDSFNPLLGLHGLDPSSTIEVEKFWQTVATPICNAGAAVTLIDHVVKNVESRGKYSYGSERKASGAIVHIGFKPLEQFGRGKTGRSVLTVHKDRPGFLPRPTVGVLALVSDGENVTYTLTQDRSRATDKFRPTFLMGRVSDYLAVQSEPVSKKNIEHNVSGKAEHVRTAIDVLVEEGYAAASDGSHGARLVEFVRHYREAEDTPAVDPETSSSQPRPDLVPSLVSTPHIVLVPSSPLIGDEDEDGVRPRPASSSQGSSDSPLAAEVLSEKTDAAVTELGLLSLGELQERYEE